MPFTVLDRNNLPKPGSDWTADNGYQQKFLALWK
jgi:hypothetical protein